MRAQIRRRQQTFIVLLAAATFLVGSSSEGGSFERLTSPAECAVVYSPSGDIAFDHTSWGGLENPTTGSADIECPFWADTSLNGTGTNEATSITVVIYGGPNTSGAQACITNWDGSSGSCSEYDSLTTTSTQTTTLTPDVSDLSGGWGSDATYYVFVVLGARSSGTATELLSVTVAR